ncbi:MAG: ATP phosphoribosyltransferase regulatory subunit, partial [Pseudomonadota bacterium]|nr:ATP phosphoribosyltransferase regulatory subunit [Pseudomonadota bacterium]
MPKPLLPTGCYDLLPPYARQESELSQALLSVFESFGYEQVSPPLLEYSDSLLAGRGQALSPQIFRVMDPGAHKVMGIRPDITLQIARIAMSRLSH